MPFRPFRSIHNQAVFSNLACQQIKHMNTMITDHGHMIPNLSILNRARVVPSPHYQLTPEPNLHASTCLFAVWVQKSTPSASSPRMGHVSMRSGDCTVGVGEDINGRVFFNVPWFLNWESIPYRTSAQGSLHFYESTGCICLNHVVNT